MRLAWMFSLLAILMLSCKEQGTNEKPRNEQPVPKDTSAVVTPQPTGNPYAGVDISPMDMTYFPVDYPKLRISSNTIDAPKARVIYSRPHLGGRKLVPDILKYGTAWRLGANESTELQLFSPATIQGKKIPAGRYILYCIPQPDKWNIVLNSFVDSWGLKQDPDRNLATFSLDITTTSHYIEYFTIIFQQKNERSADLLFAWADVEARLPIEF